MTAINRLLAGLVVAFPLFAGSAEAAPPCGLAALHWFAGTWHSEDATSQAEERWVVAAGDRLMGSAWSLHPTGSGGVIEAMTIQEDEDGIALRLRHFSSDLKRSREEKEAPMVFRLESCADQSAIFAGIGPQEGEHIAYRRSGDRLSFIGDFIHGGQPVHVEIAMARRAD